MWSIFIVFFSIFIVFYSLFFSVHQRRWSWAASCRRDRRTAVDCQGENSVGHCFRNGVLTHQRNHAQRSHFQGTIKIRKCSDTRKSCCKYPCLLFDLTVWKLSRLMTKPAKWSVRPAKAQISLGIRPVWSESSLSACRNIGPLTTYWAYSEDSDQTRRMPRLIWVFAGCICHFVGFVVRRLNW